MASVRRHSFSSKLYTRQQAKMNVAPNATYSFSFLYRLSDHAENGTLVPAFYSVDEIDEEGNVTTLLKKKKLYNEMDNKWYSLEKEFTTSETAKEVRVKVGVTGGYIYSWGGNMRLYADYDNVSLVCVDDIANGVYSIEDTMKTDKHLRVAVSGHDVDVEGVDKSSPVVVYDMTGKTIIKMSPSGNDITLTLPSSGLYLISNGSNRKTIKVAIK